MSKAFREGLNLPVKTRAEPVNQLDGQRFSMIDRALKRHRYRQDALIEVLHVTQEAFGYIPEDALVYIARKMELPWSWVYGVASFYHSFSFEPRGEHTCTVCMGTACYVRGAAEIVEALRVEIGIEPGQVSADGRISLISARCLGSCGLAPVVVIDQEVLGRETPETVRARVRALVSVGRPEAGSPENAAPPLERRETS